MTVEIRCSEWSIDGSCAHTWALQNRIHHSLTNVILARDQDLSLVFLIHTSPPHFSSATVIKLRYRTIYHLNSLHKYFWVNKMTFHIVIFEKEHFTDVAKRTMQRNTTHYQKASLQVSPQIISDFPWVYASQLVESSNKSQQWTHPHITYSPTMITAVASSLVTTGLLSPLLLHVHVLSTLSSPTYIFQSLCLACW